MKYIFEHFSGLLASGHITTNKKTQKSGVGDGTKTPAGGDADIFLDLDDH